MLIKGITKKNVCRTHRAIIDDYKLGRIGLPHRRFSTWDRRYSAHTLSISRILCRRHSNYATEAFFHWCCKRHSNVRTSRSEPPLTMIYNILLNLNCSSINICFHRRLRMNVMIMTNARSALELQNHASNVPQSMCVYTIYTCISTAFLIKLNLRNAKRA